MECQQPRDRHMNYHYYDYYYLVSRNIYFFSIKKKFKKTVATVEKKLKNYYYIINTLYTWWHMTLCATQNSGVIVFVKRKKFLSSSIQRKIFFNLVLNLIKANNSKLYIRPKRKWFFLSISKIFWSNFIYKIPFLCFINWKNVIHIKKKVFELLFSTCYQKKSFGKSFCNIFKTNIFCAFLKIILCNN
jgi:hypothetical protein